MEKFFEEQFKMLSRGIVATPNSREDLEAFAKANQGSMDMLLMQMAINFGYKIALENVQEELQKQDEGPEFDSAGFSIADREEDPEMFHHCDDLDCNCSI